MCSMGECTRKDCAPGTTCAWCALDGPRGSWRTAGVVGEKRGSAWVQDFGALSLVTPSNPVRLQSGLVRSASVRWACGLVRVARHQGYPARIKRPAIPGGGRVTSTVGLPGQTCGASALAADLWPGGARGRMPKHGQWSVGAGRRCEPVSGGRSV